jgi:hypothetical protein
LLPAFEDKKMISKLLLSNLATTMKFALFLLFVSLSIEGSVSQTSCTSADDCAQTEFCATGNICTAYGCEEYYDIIKGQLEGIGALECADYTGAIEGQVYACSVGAGLSNGSVSLIIRPESGSVIQPFERECKAAIAGEAEDGFYCLDNKDANYDDYLASAAAAGLDCEDSPIHGTVRINMLSGSSLSAVRVEEFDESIAGSGIYAVINRSGNGDDGSNAAGSGNDGSNAAGSGFVSTTLAWMTFGAVLLTALF